MAWEWVGPLCTAGVGALGIAATGITARGGRKHAEVVADQRIAHERGLAEDARRQSRMADAYVDLLSIVLRTGHYCDSVRPVLETNPPAKLPPLPPLDEQTRAEALVRAFGSREVADLFEAWRGSAWDILNADREIGFAIQMREDHGHVDPNFAAMWRRLADDLKPAQRTARDNLAEAVAVELGSRPPMPRVAT